MFDHRRLLNSVAPDQACIVACASASCSFPVALSSLFIGLVSSCWDAKWCQQLERLYQHPTIHAIYGFLLEWVGRAKHAIGVTYLGACNTYRPMASLKRFL